MKILTGTLVASLLIGFRLALSSAYPSDVVLAWDASPDPVTNYVLTAKGYANTQRFNVGTNLTGTVEGLTPGQWSFEVTAVNSAGMESDPATLNVEVPRSPANFRTLVVEHSITLTNFSDVGFFRLRLSP